MIEICTPQEIGEYIDKWVQLMPGGITRLAAESQLNYSTIRSLRNHQNPTYNLLVQMTKFIKENPIEIKDLEDLFDFA